jgi:hypothetical protein
VALPPGDLAQHAHPLHVLQRLRHRRRRDADAPGGGWEGNKGQYPIAQLSLKGYVLGSGVIGYCPQFPPVPSFLSFLQAHQPNHGVRLSSLEVRKTSRLTPVFPV